MFCGKFSLFSLLFIVQKFYTMLISVYLAFLCGTCITDD